VDRKSFADVRCSVAQEGEWWSMLIPARAYGDRELAPVDGSRAPRNAEYFLAPIEPILDYVSDRLTNYGSGGPPT
jgi:hypothetical protein